MTEERDTPEPRAAPTAASGAEGPVIEAEPEAETGELAALRQELDEARAREAEYLDGWQRARAELANARKRFQRDQEQAHGSAVGQVLARLLPIVDDFERAVAAVPAAAGGSTWLEGILLIHRKLHGLLEQEGVTPIEAAGREFDPVAHQAVTHEPSETVPEGHVIGELQKGYRMGERVLRPAMVRVSAGPAAPSTAGDELPPAAPGADRPAGDET